MPSRPEKTELSQLLSKWNKTATLKNLFNMEESHLINFTTSTNNSTLFDKTFNIPAGSGDMPKPRHAMVIRALINRDTQTLKPVFDNYIKIVKHIQAIRKSGRTSNIIKEFFSNNVHIPEAVLVNSNNQNKFSGIAIEKDIGQHTGQYYRDRKSVV
jgi:hypothetical protein